MKRLLYFGAFIALSGCAAITVTRDARVYNLQTGEVSRAVMKVHGGGYGESTVYFPGGKILTGEFSSVTQGFVSNSTMRSAGTFGGQFGWATAQGFSVTRSNAMTGSGVASGGGVVLEVVFEVDRMTGHGHGVGRDNQGHTYRLEF